jgi:hypothetical protein
MPACAGMTREYFSVDQELESGWRLLKVCLLGCYRQPGCKPASLEADPDGGHETIPNQARG